MTFLSNFKNIILYIILFVLIVGGFGVAFSMNQVYLDSVGTGDVKIISVSKLTNNIYIDSKKLNKILVVYKSTGDLSGYSLSSSCDTNIKYVGNKGNNYFYTIVFKSYCDKPTASLKDEKNKVLLKSFIRFNMIKENVLFDLYSDLNDEILSKYRKKLIKAINIKIDKKAEFYNAKKQRNLNENKYKYRILNRIIDGRRKKYKIPVDGIKMPTKHTKIPNSGRPYRKEYTDGIHHGWDFDANYGDNVKALDDGVIVRIKRDFNDSEYDNIKKSDNLTKEDKLFNLDILRGNQVWIKTTKGDVVFYSHLSEIRADLQVGYIVSREEYIGKIGVSGIPDEGYDDYHLHLPIQVNYHNTKMAGKHTNKEYMGWNWYYKGKSLEYILENQDNIFEQ